MSNVYFAGDYHWGHRNILKYRNSFSTIEEHDSVLLDNTVTCLTKRDSLYLLGDVLFNTESLKFLKTVATHCAYVFWVLGNHDDPLAVNHAIKTIPNLKVFGLKSYKGYWLSHCPIHESEFFRKEKNIHGHLHAKVLPDERYFNASVDNIAFKPVSLDAIKDGYMGELW